MTWDFNQDALRDKLIPPADAWLRLDSWRATGKEIGVWYTGGPASVASIGTLESVRNQRLKIRSSTLRAAFDLRRASFAYSQVQIYPRWPAGPAVGVMAMQVFLEHGEWLMLAEGWSPDVLPPARKRIAAS
jgi:hypothetical protein